MARGSIESGASGRRVLVAGVGNVLCGDDGFGPAVIAALAATDMPPEVTLMDAGIAGFALVRELMGGYAALVIVDAIDRGLPPGTVRVLEPEVPEIGTVSTAARADVAADAHQAVPAVALVIAKAAGALPPLVRIVGCQPQTVTACELTLSEPVRAAVQEAVTVIRRLVESTAQGRTRD